MNDENGRSRRPDAVSLIRDAIADGVCKFIYAATGRHLSGDIVLVLTDFPTDLAAMQHDSHGLLGNAWLGCGSIATVTALTAMRALDDCDIADVVFLSYDDGMYHDIGVEATYRILQNMFSISA